MSNKNPHTPDAALQSTKQMLDELDALMEKMLTLPVNDLDDAPTLPAPPALEKSALSASLTLLERSAEAPAGKNDGPSMDEPAGAPLPYHPPHFEAQPRQERERLASAYQIPEPAPLTNEVEPPPLMRDLEPLLSEIAEPPAPSLALHWVYLPLVWVNQGFDGATLAFGGAGRWMRSEVGRMLLGFLGIVMLAAGIVWFLKDYLGWQW